MTPMRFFGKTTAAVLAGLAVLAAAGCGGGGGDDDRGQTIDTGGSGRLDTVRISPQPGSVFVSRATAFQVAWTGGQEPPSQYTVALMRFKQPIGGESLDISGQRIQVSRGSGFTWNVRRDDRNDLDANGVYFLQLTAPGGQEYLSAYIVGANRAATPATRAEVIRPGTNGSLNGLVMLPRPGATFISKRTTFQIAWEGSDRPPAEFSVALRRFKEPRGDDDGSDEEQRITVTRVGTTNAWTIKRRDNFDLDESGVYYLEVAAPGETPARAAYIVSAER